MKEYHVEHASQKGLEETTISGQDAADAARQFAQGRQLGDYDRIVVTEKVPSGNARKEVFMPVFLAAEKHSRDTSSTNVLHRNESHADRQRCAPQTLPFAQFGGICLILGVCGFLYFAIGYDIDDMRGSGRQEVVPGSGFYFVEQIGAVREHRRSVQTLGRVLSGFGCVAGLILILVGKASSASRESPDEGHRDPLVKSTTAQDRTAMLRQQDISNLKVLFATKSDTKLQTILASEGRWRAEAVEAARQLLTERGVINVQAGELKRAEPNATDNPDSAG